ncbi:unnamed protein product [Nippostrongylus brasiliensis]|uniref:NTR domain-containing protein n=1 Tax=Nippostrongylus brasiliensis TaxID=27835 RepID=A0A0N4YZ86_NIPBR|nr:unnamed protein product [Nippostrongylus brasiliensis]
MVDFVLSNYTVTSLLLWMDQYRKFDYEISRTAQNNSAIAGYLKTDCPSDDICAGTLFPGHVKKKKLETGRKEKLAVTTAKVSILEKNAAELSIVTK